MLRRGRSRAAHAKHAARRHARRLSVGSPLTGISPARRSKVVGNARAVAAPLLAGDESMPMRCSPFSSVAQPRSPARQDSFRVARSAAENHAELRRHGERRTQSKCVEKKTTCGGTSSCAKTLKRPSATGCSTTRYPRSRRKPGQPRGDFLLAACSWNRCQRAPGESSTLLGPALPFLANPSLELGARHQSARLDTSR